MRPPKTVGLAFLVHYLDFAFNQQRAVVDNSNFYVWPFDPPIERRNFRAVRARVRMRVERDQYFGTEGSTSSDHARIPPFRFKILRKPARCRNSTASAERFPLRQCATISRELSSSLTRLREFAERNQVAAEIADLIFVRFANVEDVEIVAAIETRFQFARSDFGNGSLRRGSFFAANAAEFGVVDQLGDGADASPQTGQSGFLRSFSSRNRMASASKSSRRPTRDSPLPMMSFSVSAA